MDDPPIKLGQGDYERHPKITGPIDWITITLIVALASSAIAAWAS